MSVFRVVVLLRVISYVVVMVNMYEKVVVVRVLGFNWLIMSIEIVCNEFCNMYVRMMGRDVCVSSYNLLSYSWYWGSLKILDEVVCLVFDDDEYIDVGFVKRDVFLFGGWLEVFVLWVILFCVIMYGG